MVLAGAGPCQVLGTGGGAVSDRDDSETAGAGDRSRGHLLLYLRQILKNGLIK